MAEQAQKIDRRDLWLRISAVCIFGSSLFILIWLFFLQKNPAFSFGWLLVMMGYAFLAFTTTRNFINVTSRGDKKAATTETELGILSVGLIFAAPTPLLSYYFLGGVILCAVLFFLELFSKPG